MGKLFYSFKGNPTPPHPTLLKKEKRETPKTPSYLGTCSELRSCNSVFCASPEKFKTTIPEAERVCCFLVFSPSKRPVEREPVGCDHFWWCSYPCLEGWTPKITH
jgi:hypothetical protein